MMNRARVMLRPTTWLYLLAALLPFERIPSIAIAGFNLRPSLVAAVLLVITTFAADRNWYRRFWPGIYFVVAFLIVCIISSLLSHDVTHSLRITAYTLLAVLLAMAVAITIGRASLRTFCFVLVGSALIVCLIAVYQYVGDLAGLSTAETGLKPMYASGVFGFPRVQATSLEPLYFANYLLLPLAIVGSIGLVVGVSTLVITMLLIAILLTLSRGGVGVGTLMIASLTAFGLYRRRFSDAARILGAAVIAVMVVFAALSYLPKALHHHVTHSAVTAYTDQVTNYAPGNNVNIDRSQTRHLAFQDFSDHPLIGSGPGSFGQFASQYDHYSSDQIVNNEPTELLAETGIIGFACIMLFVVSLAMRAIVSYTQDKRVIHRAVLLGGLLYLGATAIQYWSFSTLYIIQVWFAIGLIMGLSERIMLTDGRTGLMKIVIERRMYGPRHFTGIGRYTMETVKGLEQTDDHNDYVILLGRNNFDEYEPASPRFTKQLAPYAHYSLAEQLFFTLAALPAEARSGAFRQF